MVSTNRPQKAALQQAAQETRDHNLIAMLSLYLLLLAFFILLNALSNLETDRARDVIASVNEAFDGQVEAVTSVEPFSAALDALDAADSLMRELRKLFETMIPAVEADVAADSPTLRLALSADLLFESDSDSLRRGRSLLLDKVSAALQKAEAEGLHYRVELLHDVAPAEGGGPRAGSLEVRRIGVLVRHLAGQGLAPAQLSVGTAAGPDGLIELIFRIYQEPPLAIDLGELAG